MGMEIFSKLEQSNVVAMPACQASTQGAGEAIPSKLEMVYDTCEHTVKATKG